MTEYVPDLTVRRPFPLEALAEHLCIELHQAGRRPDDERADAGLAALAERLGISLSTAKRRLQWGLTDKQADQAAVMCGTHPALLWRDWWPLAVDDEDTSPPTPAWLTAA